MRKPALEYLETVAREVIADQERKGIIASGRSSKSLKTGFAGNDEKGIAALRGSAYFEQQIFGRGPTRGGSGGGFLRKAIREWLDTKSFASGFSGKEKQSLSYAITKTIHRRGTRRGRDPKYPGLAFNKIKEKHKPKLLRAMGKEYSTKFRSQIVKPFR